MKVKDPKKTEVIYKATLNLVERQGLAGLNMAAIGKEAKLGMGTIYVYFRSKEELINTLFKHLKSVNTGRIYSSVKKGAPFKVNLRELFDGYMLNRKSYFKEHFFIEQCCNSRYLDEEARRLDEAAYTGIFELLNRGKAEQLVKDLDNAVLAASMIGAANELVSLCRRDNKKINKEFLLQAFLLCWDSIKR